MESFEHIGQFVATLAATDEDDNIALDQRAIVVGPRSCRRRRTGYGGFASLDQREEVSMIPLPGDQRHVLLSRRR